MEVTADGLCGVAGTPAASRGGGVTLFLREYNIYINIIFIPLYSLVIILKKIYGPIYALFMEQNWNGSINNKKNLIYLMKTKNKFNSKRGNIGDYE